MPTKTETPEGFVPDAEVPEGFQPDTPTGLAPINASTGPSTSDRIKQVASDIYTPTLKYGGAAAGAMGAEAAAIPTLAVPGVGEAIAAAAPFAGAGLGYSAGSSLAEQLDQLIGLRPTGKFLSLPTKEQVKEEASKAVENVRQGAELEGVGRTIIGPGAEFAFKGLTGAAGKVAANAPEVIARVKDIAAKAGIDLTPAEIVGTKALSAMESILDNLPWTAGKIQELRLKQLEQLNSYRDKLIAENGSEKDIEELGLKVKNLADQYMQKVGTVNKNAMSAMKDRLLQKLGSRSSYEDLDISAKEAVQRHQAVLADQVSDAYKAVADKFPEGAIVPTNARAAAEKILEEQNRLAPATRNNDLIGAANFILQNNEIPGKEVLHSNPVLRSLGKTELTPSTQEPVQKSYQELADNIKAFNQKKYAQINDPNGAYQISNAGRQWDTLIDAMRSDADALARSSGNGELIQAQDIANQLYKKKLALFEDPAFKTINNKYPGAVAKTILQSRNPELIERYKALIGNDLFNKTKDRLTNDILGLNENDIVAGDQIRQNILKLGESAKNIYSDTELGYFKKLADAVDTRAASMDEITSNPLLKTILKKGETFPSGIAGAIVKPNTKQNAAIVEQLLGSDAKKKVANAFLPQLLSTGQTGDFAPNTFAKQFNNYGYDTLKAWYGEDFANKLKDLAFLGERLGKAEKFAGNPSGTGRFLIGFYEGGRILNKAVEAVTTGGSAPAMLSLGREGAILLGTQQLAKLYASPLGRELFVDGLMTPATAKQAANLTSRILAIIGKQITTPTNEDQINE